MRILGVAALCVALSGMPSGAQADSRATLMFSGGSDPDYTGQAAAAYCVYCTDAGRGDRNIVDHCPSLIKSYRR
jgi:hypothetical protein